MNLDLPDFLNSNNYVAMIEQQAGAPPPQMSSKGLVVYFYPQAVLNPIKSEGGKMVMTLTERTEPLRKKQAEKIIASWGHGEELVAVHGRVEGRSLDDYEVEVKGAGRAIFDEQDYVCIITPGDNLNIPRRPVWELDRKRFPDQWKAYKAGQSMPMTGTPLEHWPVVTATQVAELKAIHVRTVEQLAELNDEAALRSPGLVTLKQRAQAYLDAAKSGAAAQQLVTKNKQLEGELDLMRTQLAEMQRQMKELEKGPAAKK